MFMFNVTEMLTIFSVSCCCDNINYIIQQISITVCSVDLLLQESLHPNMVSDHINLMFYVWCLKYMFVAELF